MIYLDNAATSFPKPESVYQTLDRFARTNLANPGRAGHKMALAAEHALDDCRHLLNQLFHGENPDRFVFTLNCTDGLNMAIKGVVRDGDHVITSDLEHNSISRPLRALELSGRITLTRMTADAGGTLDPEALRRALTPKTRLIALTHASNVLGTVQPLAAIGQIARERNVLLLVDAAQTAGVIPIDVQALHIDMLAFPGHKSLLGPTGTGALYVSSRVDVSAWREGGTGGDSASETQPKEFPYFLEGGTPNVLGVAGLAAGIKYVMERGLDKIHAHEVGLTEMLWQRLDAIGGIEIFGHRDMARRVGTLSFRAEALPAAEIGGILDQAFDIAIRPGLHCAPYIHRSIGTFPDGAVRVSPGAFSSADDIDTLAGALHEILSWPIPSMDMRSHYIDWDKPIDITCQGGALTVGNFDGVHRGHQALLAELSAQALCAAGGPAVALTFDPHPLQILRPDSCPPLLTTVAQRAELLHQHGADVVLILRTNHAMLQLSARGVFERVLRDQIRPRVIVPGFNFAFGHNREGTVAKLAEFCREANIGFVQVEPAQVGGETISSSRIGAALGAGEVRTAAELLDRPYALTGMVVKGMQRGQELGFPTANLDNIQTLLPANGVYAGRARVGAQDWPAALNIGPNPTFGEHARKIEAHLIGFSGNLYGAALTVAFVERLRDTKPFASVPALVEQLTKDVAEAQRLASGVA